MPKRVPPLTDIQCKNAKPKNKPYTLSDGQGLYLLVNQNSKLWRMKYRYKGKEKLASFGPYPEVTLAKARSARENIRAMIRDGIDPAAQKRQQQLDSSNTFEALARDWHSKQLAKWKKDHAAQVLRSLEKEIFPIMGSDTPTDVEPSRILNIIRAIEKRGANETASRVLQRVSNVFSYGMIVGLCKSNPAAGLAKALEQHKTQGYRYISSEQLANFMAKLNSYSGEATTALGLKLLIHTFLRPGEVRFGRWEEIDWGNALWRIPGQRMKIERDHLVPLTAASLEILQQLQTLTGRYELILPSATNKKKAISENTLNAAVKRLGFEATAHGFRKTASTWLNEQGFHADAIERQLAHVPANAVRGIYNKAQYMDERCKMMAAWSKFVSGTIETNSKVKEEEHQALA